MRIRVCLTALALGMLGVGGAASARAQESRPALARPTADQLAWHDCELGMFIHFAPNTWTDLEYDDLSLPLDKFNPDKLDTDQWVAAAEALGARYIVFVAKHAGGFCLWQTETTDYSVKSTPWRHGRGDILADLAASCHKRGMRLGVYVSPADRKHGAEVGGKCATPAAQKAYDALYRAQLTEVLTTINRVHGDPPAGGVFEVWFDGSIVVPVGDILAKLAPHAMIFQGPHATIRWVGNEDGVAPYPAWNAVPATAARTGEATAQQGDPQGTVWLPNECDARMRDTWFWNTKNAAALKSVDTLMDMYCRSVGHGAVLLLNQTPDPTGLIPEADVQRGAEFAVEIRRRFGHSLAETSGHGEVVELALKEPAVIQHCVIMEDIAQGERVREYVVEALVDRQWKELARGTAIGHKKIDRFSPATTNKVRLRVLRSVGEPQIRRFAAFADASPTASSTLDSYNVVWPSPSADASGSMPIGNGVVGLNVWVEEGGDLLFYVARVDAWSECERLLKLGRIRVSLVPNPFVAGQPFRQELILREGRIAIAAGASHEQVDLVLLVDAHAPVVHIDVRSAASIRLTASLETWRTERRVLTDKVESSWTMRDAPDDIVQREAWESADVVADDPAAVIWYHRNEHSIVPFTLKHQGLEAIADRFRDPLILRTFGGRMEGPQLRKTGPASLAADGVTAATIRITTHSAQTPTLAAWLDTVKQMAAASPADDVLRSATARWWANFWDRSWIFVTGDPVQAAGPHDPAPPSRVTQAYLLQRWMIACASRGDFPPKFNGSIFTVDPKFTEGQPFNADWRKWGGDYWWQNTRLPYYPMLAAGDFDLMQPLFSFYEGAVRGCQARAQLYCHVDGVYFPETMTTFATYANSDYGWNRAGVDRSVIQSPWWQWAWQQSLELSQLMLDYAAYTGDERFLTERALPMAREALRYYDSRFARDERGKLVISPTQAVETYWHDVVNDAPSVAGLHAVCDALLALPPRIGTPADRVLWQRMKDAAPDLPTRRIDGQLVMSPAEKFTDQRSNVETPELYGLFPFRVLGLDKPNFDAALEAYRRRSDKSHVGWTQDGAFAALLGLTEEAQVDLLAKARNSHPGFRFPAMWGPNFDWLPDQDHGSNLMTLLQLMLLQCDGHRIRLLPAWPKEWDVSFKLRAPFDTTVECEYRSGAIVALRVTPEARRADVVAGVKTR
jgi:alpha-L-fucosidase